MRNVAIALLLTIAMSSAANTNTTLTPSTIAGHWNVISATRDGVLAEKGWSQVWALDTNQWVCTFTTHDPKGVLGTNRHRRTEEQCAFAISGSVLRLMHTRTRGSWDPVTNSLEFMTFTHTYEAEILDDRLILRLAGSSTELESGRHTTTTNDGEIILQKVDEPQQTGTE